MKLNDKALHMKLDSQLYNDLKKVADNLHMSLASLVRMACSQWLRENGNTTANSELDAVWAALPAIEE